MVTYYNQNNSQATSQRISVDWESGGILLDDNIYLYPDMETALVGDWSSGKMSSARQTTITSVSVDTDNMLSVKHGDCFGPEFSYAPAGEDNFGESDPMLLDPYENRF